MIFITVGTHEQGMERLLKEVDKLISNREITDEVFAQIGYSTYVPKNYKYKDLIGYDEMDKLVKKSSIIITHGGPGSIFHAIQHRKIPIVVPRNPEFNEHVDNHQILFTERLERQNKVIGVYDINHLEDAISNYNENIIKCNLEDSENKMFVKKFSELLKSKINIK